MAKESNDSPHNVGQGEGSPPSPTLPAHIYTYDIDFEQWKANHRLHGLSYSSYKDEFRVFKVATCNKCKQTCVYDEEEISK